VFEPCGEGRVFGERTRLTKVLSPTAVSSLAVKSADSSTRSLARPSFKQKTPTLPSLEPPKLQPQTVHAVDTNLDQYEARALLTPHDNITHNRACPVAHERERERET
jgi:hypothetical protein